MQKSIPYKMYAITANTTDQDQRRPTQEGTIDLIPAQIPAQVENIANMVVREAKTAMFHELLCKSESYQKICIYIEIQNSYRPFHFSYPAVDAHTPLKSVLSYDDYAMHRNIILWLYPHILGAF